MKLFYLFFRETNDELFRCRPKKWRRKTCKTPRTRHISSYDAWRGHALELGKKRHLGRWSRRYEGRSWPLLVV